MRPAGLMYLRLPLDTATAGYNRSAALWVSMFAFTLMPSETACSVWNQERAVVSPASLPEEASLSCLCDRWDSLGVLWCLAMFGRLCLCSTAYADRLLSVLQQCDSGCAGMFGSVQVPVHAPLQQAGGVGLYPWPVARMMG